MLACALDVYARLLSYVALKAHFCVVHADAKKKQILMQRKTLFQACKSLHQCIGSCE